MYPCRSLSLGDALSWRSCDIITAAVVDYDDYILSMAPFNSDEDAAFQWM